jgi:pilus assembly protein CpaC
VKKYLPTECKSLTHEAAAASALLLAFLFPIPRLAAQSATQTAATPNHNDLFTKPALTDHAPIASPAGDFVSMPPIEQQLHLMVGRSTFVNTRHRLTRVYVTTPSVLDTYTASPNEIVVTAKKPGTSNLIVWDEAGEAQSFAITSDVNISTLRDAMKQAMPNENIGVSGDEGRVVLTGTVGTEKIADAVVKLASQYSKDVTSALVVNSAHVKQVTLKVRIVEVDRSKLNAFAFNFFNLSSKLPAGTTTGQAPSTIATTAATATSAATIAITNPLNFFIASSKLNIGATLQDLQTLNILQVLAEPTITAMSGEKGSFLAGGEFPFPIVQGNSTGLASVTIQFKPYGVKLEFTPTVNDDGTIDLKVAPEVSTLDYSNSVQISGYTIPALSSRKAETEVTLRSGQTFEISGLLNKTATDQFENTPGISNIPILGQLFKSKNVNHATQELVVIVTPTVVDPVSDTALPEEPKLPVPMLDYSKFDQAVPENKKK